MKKGIVIRKSGSHLIKFLFTVLVGMMGYQSNSQSLWGDLHLGATNYQGDLQDNSYLFNGAHIAGGLGLSYDFTEHISGRFRLLFGKISGDDKNTMNVKRNLNFKSPITEGQLGVQYNIFSLEERSATPYLFAAVALFHFDPYTFDTAGKKYFLHPLSTEGEGIVDGIEPYKLTQFSIPFGGGLQLALDENMRVGIEVGARKTFTNHLDDVGGRYVDQSTLFAERGQKAVELAFRGWEIDHAATYPATGSLRSFSKVDDWYFYTAITFSIRLTGRYDNGYGMRGFGGKRSKNSFSNCPVL